MSTEGIHKHGECVLLQERTHEKIALKIGLVATVKLRETARGANMMREAENPFPFEESGAVVKEALSAK